jgi:hypothetical protein
VATRERHLIVLFEDDSKRKRSLVRLIRESLSRSFQVVAFEPEAVRRPVGPYEDRLRDELVRCHHDEALLYVSDRDLSKVTGYLGLSEAAVSRAAERFGVPVALYAQGKSYRVLSRETFPGDGRLVLRDGTLVHHATEIARLARGFLETAGGIDGILKKRIDDRSPASVAAHLMGRPQYSDRIAQYALGDQKTWAEVVRSTALAATDTGQLRRRHTRLIGTWIYDSILRFPGLVLDVTAAGSYLDILPSLLSRDAEIQRLFESALYDGPFSDKEQPMWWRPDIDNLLLDENVETGRRLVKKKLRRTVSRCPCSVDPKLRAGFFCMLTLEPISEQESAGGLSWFPPGADLARVNKRQLEELRPWLALY